MEDARRIGQVGERAARLGHALKNAVHCLRGFTQIIGARVGGSSDALEALDGLRASVDGLEALARSSLQPASHPDEPEPAMTGVQFNRAVEEAVRGVVRCYPGILCRFLLRAPAAGCLFLDELEAMDVAQQAKLLRIMDDGECRPVGCAKSCRVSVRFLAATNRDPQELIRTGELREDLYYRLRGVQICLPTLSERRADIPLLAQHFLGKLQLTPEAAQALERQDWPGNVRELKNVVQAAESIAGGNPIGPRHLQLPSPSSAGGAPSLRPAAAVQTLKDAERQVILNALTAHKGNRMRAALAIGVDRSTLRRKMSQMGIAFPEK